VAARSKVSVGGSSLAGIAGSNPTGGMDVCLLLSVVCCQVEVSATGCSRVHSLAECGVSNLRSLDNEEALAH
jgi:hypothetical protein